MVKMPYLDRSTEDGRNFLRHSIEAWQDYVCMMIPPEGVAKPGDCEMTIFGPACYLPTLLPPRVRKTRHVISHSREPPCKIHLRSILLRVMKTPCGDKAYVQFLRSTSVIALIVLSAVESQVYLRAAVLEFDDIHSHLSLS